MYVSFSPFRGLVRQFQCLVRLRKHSQPWKKVHRRNITGPVLHIRMIKRIHYWRGPKTSPKLSKDGKLTVKKDEHLVVSSSNFSRPFYHVSYQFGNLFS